MSRYTSIFFALGSILAACGGGDTLGGSADAGADANAITDAAAHDAQPPDAGFDAAINTAPTISNIDDQTTQFAPVGPIAFQVGDAQSLPSALTVTAISSNQDVLPDSGIVLGGTDALRTIVLTPVASGTSTVTLTVTDGIFNTVGSFDLSVTNTPPLGVADSFTTVGNTAIEVAADQGVLGNDTDGDGDTIAVIADSIVSSMGGSVELSEDGSFTYLPPVGVRDSVDTFEYQITDGFASATGTASITINNLVWYVDNTAAASGDGRSLLPVQTLGEAEAASGANDIIFVQGDSYTAGIELQNGQALIGAPAGLTVDAAELVPPSATRPVISDAAGIGVGLASTGEIRGLAISDTANDAIRGAAVTNVTIEDVIITRAGVDGIDLDNANPAGTVAIQIDRVTIRGDAAFSSTNTGIDINVDGNGGGNADVAITNTTIREVQVGIALAVGGTTGTGAGGNNSLVLSNDTVADFEVDGIQIEPDDTAATSISLIDNVIDGVDEVVTATPDRGLDVRVRTGAGGATTMVMQGNQIRDISVLACANIISTGSNNGGTFVTSVQGNGFSSCGQEGLLLSPNGALQFSATVDGNTMTGNAAPSTFEFITDGTPNVLNLNLLNNDDDAGFLFERSSAGVLNLGGTLGQGSSFDDDNGNVANNSNTSGGNAPIVTIVSEPSPLQINIIDPATVATP